MAAHKLRKAFDHFFDTTKKGYDQTNWIFVIIAGAGIITKLFGFGGAIASIIAFAFFYLLGRMSLRRDKRREREAAEEKRKKRKKSS